MNTKWQEKSMIVRPCLFSGKWFLENHFPNFPMFVCHYESWSTKNTFQSKKNLAWFPVKCFPGKFRRKTFSESCEKFRNVILFADYIKFGSQNFNCYIYIYIYIYCFDFFFNFIP